MFCPRYMFPLAAGSAVVLAALVIVWILRAQQVSVTQIEFVRTITTVETGEVVTLYHGTRYYADDGRIRVDIVRNSNTATTLWLPEGREPGFNPGLRFDLDHATQSATVSSTQFYWPDPDVETAPAQTVQEQSPETRYSEPLGRRMIGPLGVVGFRYVDGSTTTVSWVVETSPKTEVLEERFEDGRIINELKITAVTPTVADEEKFLVPDGYDIEESAPWLVR